MKPMKPVKTPTPVSIYNRPEVQQQLEAKRAALAARGITGPLVPIGRTAFLNRAPTPIPVDQQWVTRAMLG